jgi:hypothetical protein
VVIPYPALVPDQDSPAPPPPESGWGTRPRAWPARQGQAPGYLKRRRPLDRPTRDPPCLAAALRRHRNPSAAAVGFSSPPSLRRREVAKEPRKEVSIAPAPLDVESVLRRDRKTSPEFVGRAAASTGRSAATPSRPPPRPASRARALRVGAARASHRAPEPYIGYAGELRRRPPPRTAVSSRPPSLWPLARDPGRRIKIRRPCPIPPPACHRSPWI